MRNLFSLLLVAVLVPVGAEALAAQQPQGTMTNHTMTQTTHRARRHHRRHETTTKQAVVKNARAEHESVATERKEVRHARTMRHTRRHTRLERREMVMNPNPTVLGTPASGFPAPPQPAMRVNNMGSSGISSSGRLQRLGNGLITPDAARSIALRTIPNGTSVDKIRLRTEDGRQVYDVKVVTPNQTGNELVRVDAHTGAVVETKNVDNPVGTVTGAVKKTVNKVTHH